MEPADLTGKLQYLAFRQAPGEKEGHKERFGNKHTLLLFSYKCFKNVELFILQVWVFILPVCMCNMCVPGAYGIQKRVLDSLKLKLEMVVNYHVDDGKETQVFCSNSKCS